MMHWKESIPLKEYELSRWLEATCSACGRKQGKRGKLRLFAKAGELDCLCAMCFKKKFPKRR